MSSEPLPPSYEDSRAAGASPNNGPAIAMQPMGQPNMNTGNADKVTRLTHLGPMPEWIDCPFCKQRTKTNVVQSGGGMQFLTGTLLCLVCICLAPLPCMLHWFEETQWFCTGCNKVVATKRHDMPVQPVATYEEQHTDSRFQAPQQPQQPQPAHLQGQQPAFAPAAASSPAPPVQQQQQQQPEPEQHGIAPAPQQELPTQPPTKS
ncbi:hypothetical protein B0I35DRAFT_407154 [Stachybotrys elegans]|uniref:LITAF domain-containing protein n=1 Tax=Stachybotrys elegans TaxID=80388 RepID=A0A8K0SRK9_9HYPO|nr:hypothetical protein B0I35DRAFT_407154 [Stachybotrys elegans]